MPSHGNHWRHACHWPVLLAALALGQSAPEGVLYDEVVAAIDGQAVTASQLALEARILLVDDGLPVPQVVEMLEPGLLLASLRRMIDHRLATREVEQLSVTPVEPQEVELRVARVLERLERAGQRDAFFKDHDAGPEEVRQVLRRRLAAEKTLESRVRLASQLSDAELKKQVQARPELQGRSAVSVRAQLLKERVERLVREELQRLRRAADVRLLGAYAGQALEASGP